MAGPAVRSAGFAELDARTLYAILALRVSVFVVEQACPYPELDGRDLEPAAVHLWAEENGEVLSYLRLLHEPDGMLDGRARIGRVCTAASARGRGLGRRLMAAALEEAGEGATVLQAQSYLRGWYAGLGYEATGDEYLEDGIPHVDMHRPAGPLPS